MGERTDSVSCLDFGEGKGDLGCDLFYGTVFVGVKEVLDAHETGEAEGGQAEDAQEADAVLQGGDLGVDA